MPVAGGGEAGGYHVQDRSPGLVALFPLLPWRHPSLTPGLIVGLDSVDVCGVWIARPVSFHCETQP